MGPAVPARTSPTYMPGPRCTCLVPGGSGSMPPPAYSPAKVTSRWPVPPSHPRRLPSPAWWRRAKQRWNTAMWCAVSTKIRASPCRTPSTNGRPLTRWAATLTRYWWQVMCASPWAVSPRSSPSATWRPRNGPRRRTVQPNGWRRGRWPDAWPLGMHPAACSTMVRASGIPAKHCHGGRSVCCGAATVNPCGEIQPFWPTPNSPEPIPPRM